MTILPVITTIERLCADALVAAKRRIGHRINPATCNLLTAIIVYWNTLHLGRAVEARRREGLDTPRSPSRPCLTARVGAPLLTGEYRWPKDTDT